MSLRLVKRWKASSIMPGVVFESHTMKLEVLRASTFPMPASSMPVTVSSSPITAMSEPTAALEAALPAGSIFEMEPCFCAGGMFHV